MRWHLAKKRWAKSRSEFFYDIRQNIRALQKAVKHFFVKSKYEKHTKTKAPVYTFLAFLVFVSLGYLAFISAPNIRQGLKSYELFKKAEDYFDQSDITQAFWHSYTSYDYEGGKHRYENLKILAHSALALNRYETTQFLSELAHHEKATVDDSILYIQFCLDRKRFDEAKLHFKNVDQLFDSNPNVKLLHLRIINQNWRKNFDDVLRLSRELVHVSKLQDPSLDEIYLNISMREKQYAKESISYLYQLTQRSDLSSLIALRKAIAPLPYNNFTQEQTNSFLIDYLNHPLANHTDRVKAFTEAYRRGLVPQVKLDQFLEKEFSVSEPHILSIIKVKELMDLIIHLNIPHKITSYIPPEIVVQDKLLYTDYLLVLMNLGKFDEANELINNTQSQYTKSERNIIDAISRVKKSKLKQLNTTGKSEAVFTGILGNSAIIDNHNISHSSDPFNTFFEYGYSSADVKEFTLIEHLFDIVPHTTSLLKYFESIIEKSQQLKSRAQVLILKLHQENQDEESVLKTLNDFGPLGNLNDEQSGYILYRKILYGIDSEECLERLESMTSRDISAPAIIIALSLGYYLANKPSIALRTLEECNLQSLFERPGNQVIAALIFDANRRVQDSRHFISNLNFDSLLPPERKLALRLLQTNNLKTGKI